MTPATLKFTKPQPASNTVAHELGSRIERLWRRKGYSRTAFRRISENAIAHLYLPASFVEEALERGARIQEMPPDPDRVAPNPKVAPLIFYRSQRIQVDLWIRRNVSTTLHSHSFDAVFIQLAGSGLYTRYRFETEQRHGRDVKSGRLLHHASERLCSGDIRALSRGERYIHQVCSLSDPQCTLIVRALDPSGVSRAFRYFPPGLAVRKEWNLSPNAWTEMDEALQGLPRNREDVVSLFARLLKEKNHQQALHFLIQIIRVTGESSIVELLLQKHRPPWGGAFRRTLKTQDNVTHILPRVKGEGPRLLYAALCLIPDPHTFGRILGSAAAPRTLTEALSEWTAELVHQGVLGFSWNDSMASIFQSLLEGRGTEAIAASTSRLGGAPGAERIRRETVAAVDSLRSVPMLDTLLRFTSTLARHPNFG